MVIALDEFKQRFAALTLAGGGIPKRPEDRQLLAASVASRIEPGRVYNEREIGLVLQGWCNSFGWRFAVDHVELRRMLVDMGLVRRNAAGSQYEVSAEANAALYDPAIRELDLEQVVQEARDERERKKREFLKAQRDKEAR